MRSTLLMTVPGRGPAYTVTYLFCACFYAAREPRNVLTYPTDQFIATCLSMSEYDN